MDPILNDMNMAGKLTGDVFEMNNGRLIPAVGLGTSRVRFIAVKEYLYRFIIRNLIFCIYHCL